MEDDEKNPNGRRQKKVEHDKKKSKLKTTKKCQNGRRPKKLKMENDQKISKWKTTRKFKMEKDQKNSK